jgi:hypothetical protein
VAHETNGAEQVALNHQRVKPRHALFRIDPAQDEGALNGRGGIGHRSVSSSSPR